MVEIDEALAEILETVELTKDGLRIILNGEYGLSILLHTVDSKTEIDLRLL